jgi:hypothetical protein
MSSQDVYTERLIASLLATMIFGEAWASKSWAWLLSPPSRSLESLTQPLRGEVTGSIELTPISGLLHAHPMYDVPDRTGKFCATSMEMMSGAGLI